MSVGKKITLNFTSTTFHLEHGCKHCILAHVMRSVPQGILPNDDALTHRREVCFFTPKNKREKKQIALSAMLVLGFKNP